MSGKTKKQPLGAGKRGQREKPGTLSPAQVQALARQHTVEALNALLEIMRDPTADPEARAEATKELRLRLRQLGFRCAEKKSAGSP